MSKSKSNIQAVLDTDLEKLLAQTNQLHDFIEGKISCPKCGTIITEDNVGILYPYEIEGNTKRYYFVFMDWNNQYSIIPKVFYWFNAIFIKFSMAFFT